MLVTELGMVTDVKPLQRKNAQSPMLVTEFGMVTEVKPLFWNASEPMLVTEFGMVTEVKPLQPSNANVPMLVTEYVLPPFSTVSGISITSNL